MKLEKPLWFKAKLNGWGWYPVTWQGWLILALFVVVMVAIFFEVDRVSHSVSDTLIQFFPQLILGVLLLIGICSLTGEKPGWRWGDTRSFMTEERYQPKIEQQDGDIRKE